MEKIIKYIILIISAIRCIPHILVFYLHKNKSLIECDLKQAFVFMEREIIKPPFGLIFLLTYVRQFRNVYYYRVRPFSSVLNFLCPKLNSLEITSPRIDEGLTIVHGYATIIGADSIGKNCVIYQQVTVGGITNYGSPIILDDVTIFAGAVIIGKVTIGNNSVIGANATVYMDVPDNCTVLPGSSKIMRWKKS